jgi:hypothetical protein
VDSQEDYDARHQEAVMGAEFCLGVMAVDEAGELRVEYVRDPRLAVADMLVRELLGRDDGERWFPEVRRGLELAWYSPTSMARCEAESRGPVRGDCFEPAHVRSEVQALRERLAEMEARLPRRFRFQLSTRVGDWRDHARVFHGGKLFNVNASWGSCRARWYDERPHMETLEVRLFGAPDIEHDLRHVRSFACVEAVRDGTDARPGDPMTLIVSSKGASEHFEPVLKPIVDFCDQAEAGGYLVFTSHV